MRDSTYVVIALAFCSLVMLALSMQKPKLSMLELEDFKHLPVEIRSALRRMLPDGAAIRQKWSHLSSHEKQDVIQRISGFIPQHRPQRPQYRQPYENRVAPTLEAVAEETVITEETEETVITEETEKVLPDPVPLKKGFLDTVKKGKKKDTKNKKEDEVIALSAVGADVPTNVGADGSFLGGDD